MNLVEDSSDGPPDSDTPLEVPELLRELQDSDCRAGFAQHHRNLNDKR